MSPTKHWIYVGMLGMSGMSEFMGVSSIYQWHSNMGNRIRTSGKQGELPRLFSPNGRVLLANVQIEMSSELRCISALDGRRETTPGSSWWGSYRWGDLGGQQSFFGQKCCSHGSHALMWAKFVWIMQSLKNGHWKHAEHRCTLLIWLSGDPGYPDLTSCREQ
jgi:hypothetical protein